MDRLDAMRVFTRVLERRSFTHAARDLNLPRSTVTDAVKGLELRLGAQLLQRTTRHVVPTLDGEAYYRRCLAILADVEEADGAFRPARPKGVLRVDVHGTLARHFILPNLPDFLSAFPELHFQMSEGDRLVDPVREGIDCVLRAGTLRDSDMIARRVASLEEMTLAAPHYLDHRGRPRDPGALADGHQMVGFHSTASGGVLPLEFCVDGRVDAVTLPTVAVFSGAETYVAAARLGLGLIQVPRYHVAQDLQSGALESVLPAFPPPPTPVHVLYPRSRQLSPRVRVFVDFVAGVFARGAGTPP